MQQALSTTVRPSHYDLRIEPDLEEATFEGTVAIEIDVLEETSTIILHADQLQINSTTIYDGYGKSLALVNTQSHNKSQTFEILFESPIPALSKIVLKQAFSGRLQYSLEGFGLTPKTIHRNSIAATNLEPSSARTVFPCFDEPCFKSTFSVTLVTLRHLMCLGNMPVQTVTEIPGPQIKRAIEFKRSSLMPTYLVAFAVGEFNMIENNNFRIPIRAYAPHDFDIENCRYTLDIAARALELHEKIFQIECGLTKLDIIAIPVGSDITAAMENWGLVTVATGVLIISPESSASDRALSASIIAHELAHQWFGNLVTMASWDTLWIKEGLAEWADANVREQMSGEQPWDEFVSDSMQLALEFDSTRFTHSLEPSNDKMKNSPYFDHITYRKGCAIFRMLANRLGRETFIGGLRRYLQKQIYGNARTEDLWAALALASGLDIGKMMKYWTHQEGFPLLVVEENTESSTITITQERFLLSQVKGKMYEDAIYSPIFLNISTPNGIIHEVLEGKSRTVTVPLDAYYKLNTNQITFYRVAYPASRLLNLTSDLYRNSLLVTDRIGLITDTAALTFACHPTTRLSTLLFLLRNFLDEKNYFVWRSIISTLQTIQKSILFEEKSLIHAFNEYQKKLVKQCLYKKGTFRKDDDLNETRFKALLQGNSGGDEKFREAAWEMFGRFTRGDLRFVNPNIRVDVFKLVLTEGGKKEYETLLSLLPTTTSPLRKAILSSLGYSQNTSCIKQTLRLACSPTCIVNYESLTILQSLTSHKIGLKALWKFLENRLWETVPGLSVEKVVPVVEMVVGAMTTEDGYKRSVTFWASLKDEELGGDFRREKSLEGVRARIEWLKRDRGELGKWLKGNGFYKKEGGKGVSNICGGFNCLK